MRPNHAEPGTQDHCCLHSSAFTFWFPAPPFAGMRRRCAGDASSESESCVLILRISRETFPGSDHGRRAYLILKPVLVIIIIVVIDVLELIVIVKVLEFESASGKVVDRTGDDLTQSEL